MSANIENDPHRRSDGSGMGRFPIQSPKRRQPQRFCVLNFLEMFGKFGFECCKYRW
jgi:hypothetical protein